MQKIVKSSDNSSLKWSYSDTAWMLSLYGTAIGAGVLFLPINAGAGGLIPLIVLAIIVFPMTYLSHHALCRFVLCGNATDITVVVEEQFGKYFGYLITFLYFLAIYPLLLVLIVSLTNTVESFVQYQLHLQPLPRIIIGFVLSALLMCIVQFGEHLIVRIMSTLVYPLIAVLLIISIALIPQWSLDLFREVSLRGASNHGGNGLLLTLWLTIPVAVFSFNHSPIISSLAVSQSKINKKNAPYKCGKIIKYSNIMMVVTVMFFVFSCALCLSPINLQEAKYQNISILSYLANHYNSPFLKWVAPIVAFLAISKTYLGHYLGTREGINGMISKTLILCQCKPISLKLSNRLGIGFIFITCWAIATYNPSILVMIESISGPILAILLFLLPMYAIHTLPALKQYKGKLSNVFVVIMGSIAVSAAIYQFFY
ncbi:Serine transporter [Commensalibacter sp. Nvir]|uniref:aromatic amino acid transport family protein n=1 Tax=Commensalibacter sp. Nvir TaxID=3069817 RepID=UPI002D3CD70C|nr:Serine transporter [Commensalibacter sp. Nvir]